MKENRFYKTERLCGRRDFELLFSDSKSLFVYPFKVVYRFVDYEPQHELKLGISVSKKSFKRAVKRNFVKRRIREGYRLNNHPLKAALQAQHMGMHLMLVYVSKELLDFNELELKIKRIVEKLTKELTPASGVDADTAN